MEFIGPDQTVAQGIFVPGLLDTGADRTALPFDYAEQLGYRTEDLRLSHVQQVQGAAEIHMASRPCKAWVSGAEWHTLEITPIFVPGAYNALWGMHDVMAAFPAITFDSRAQKYTLHFPDPPEDV